MILHKEIYKAKLGDQESFLKILKQFEPTILKFSRELGYEEAQSDLIISLLEFFRKPSNNHIIPSTEGAAVTYIYRLLKNRRNDLFKKNISDFVEIPVFSDFLEAQPSKEKIDETYILHDSLKQLKQKTKNIIILRYIYGYSDNEIATLMKISRQAVCKIRNSGLRKLKN